MKKVTAILASVLFLLTAVSCGNNGSQQSAQEQSSLAVPVQDAEPSVLNNKMTDSERSRVDKHALTLLDDPSKQEHQVSIELTHCPAEEQLQYLDQLKEQGLVEPEEYEELYAQAKKLLDEGKELEIVKYVLVDGCYYCGLTPPEDYDGGELRFTTSIMETGEDGEPVEKTVAKSCANFEEYLDTLETESLKKQARLVFAAFADHSYTLLPEGYIDFENPPVGLWNDPFDDKRSTWELDREAVQAIADSIDEYSIYDAEMQVEFLVHVTRPPEYDPAKTYPVILLIDAVWRFGNVPAMRQLIADGKAAPVLIATLGYNYRMDGTNEYYRFTHLVEQRDQLLDFITDNLMPYLCENYRIDCENSTLFGHSDGGVFAHNALFNSDRYENQPFGRYIIGSPAFFGLYDEDAQVNLRPDEALNDYGYFDRHETLDKRVWLCGGSQEDPDYEDLYRGHDTTLEGLVHLRDRIGAHSKDYFYKLYESHHYQYIPEMLTEYLKTEYPV